MPISQILAASGSSLIPPGIEYLVVGGGGGGASYQGGGGGAGGVIRGILGLASALPNPIGYPGCQNPITSQILNIEIGGGGSPAIGGGSAGNGGASSISGIIGSENKLVIGYGGGAGGSYGSSGSSGGSGGGGGPRDAFPYSNPGGSRLSFTDPCTGFSITQGNQGGQGYSGSPPYPGGGGGGGAGSAGGSKSSSFGQAGNGGNGISHDITGNSLIYGGGGGGGQYDDPVTGQPFAGAGSGGSGGGGRGGVGWRAQGTFRYRDPTAGLDGLGGGGGAGGGSQNGARGGSGVVVIRHTISWPKAFYESNGGIVNYSEVGGYRIYEFKSNGSNFATGRLIFL